ncbi:unnamed protein product [Brugia timori]|uniref:Ovule protein n=1 Tax=Brugia timori TaxID=42155 RepID=A0A0R3QH96_9BILA|nr:unnamed protein product [Brugia timori]
MRIVIEYLDFRNLSGCKVEFHWSLNLFSFKVVNENVLRKDNSHLELSHYRVKIFFLEFKKLRIFP